MKVLLLSHYRRLGASSRVRSCWYLPYLEAIVSRGADKPIPTSEYPTPARRQAYSALRNEKFSHSFGLKLPNWRTQLELALSV